MAGQSSGGDAAPGSPTPAGRRAQWPRLFSLCLLAWGCKGCAAGKSERREKWSAVAQRCVILWARQPHPMGRVRAGPPPVGQLRSRSSRSAAKWHPRGSAYLFICAAQKWFLATEIESSFGQKFQCVMGMSAVLCSFVFFSKPGFLQTDIFTCLLCNIGMGFMKSP